VETLRRSADVVARAAEAVERSSPAALPPAAAAGIPGAAAAMVLEQVASAWRDRVQGWTAQARRHADGLQASAATYGRTEAWSTQDFSSISAALDGTWTVGITDPGTAGPGNWT